MTANGYLGNEQRALFRVMDLRMLLYPLVFVFCWGPGAFLSDQAAARLQGPSDAVSVCFWAFSAVTLAFLRVAKPSSGHGVLGVCLYISEVSLVLGGDAPIRSHRADTLRSDL